MFYCSVIQTSKINAINDKLKETIAENKALKEQLIFSNSFF